MRSLARLDQFVARKTLRFLIQGEFLLGENGELEFIQSQEALVVRVDYSWLTGKVISHSINTLGVGFP